MPTSSRNRARGSNASSDSVKGSRRRRKLKPTRAPSVLPAVPSGAGARSPSRNGDSPGIRGGRSVGKDGQIPGSYGEGPSGGLSSFGRPNPRGERRWVFHARSARESPRPRSAPNPDHGGKTLGLPAL